MFRRLAQFCVPSALGVCLASLVASLAETAPHTYEAGDAMAGAGFLLVFALPIGLCLSIVGRGLWQAWQLEALIAPTRDQRGASPRVSAWIVFLVAASVVLCIGTFQGMRLLFLSTRINTLVALSAPAVVLAIVLLLVACSRPMVGLLERGIGGIEDRRAARDKRPIFAPAQLAVGIAILALAMVVSSWFLLILPNIGHLDIGFAIYLVVFLVGVIVFPLLWQRLELPPRARKWAASLVCLAVIACAAASVKTRYQRPYKMLEIWGETKLAGWAIDTIYDVQSLRVDLSIEGITPTPIPEASHPNIVVVTIDTVRADHVPLYGGKAKMPALAELGKKAAVFERAFSPGNVTRRSLPTLATGLSPGRVRGRVVGWALRMDPRHVLLAERFRAGGYDTAGFFCCRSHFGRDHRLGLIRGLEHVQIEYEGKPLTEKAVDWLRARGQGGKPLFMWTHYIEPHNWAKDHKPKKGARRRGERYDLSLEATDEFLATLLAGIRESLGDNTVIVVTADHGEGLGDHGIKNHSGSLYNSEIRVPLVIAGPDIPAARIEQATGLVDLAPTLLELAGFRPPGMPQMDGLSVAPELRGERDDKLGAGEAYSVMVADRSVGENRGAVISGRYKLIEREGSVYELFDLSRDPKEKQDIVEDATELFESMKARLARRQALDRVPPF